MIGGCWWCGTRVAVSVQRLLQLLLLLLGWILLRATIQQQPWRRRRQRRRRGRQRPRRARPCNDAACVVLCWGGSIGCERQRGQTSAIGCVIRVERRRRESDSAKEGRWEPQRRPTARPPMDSVTAPSNSDGRTIRMLTPRSTYPTTHRPSNAIAAHSKSRSTLWQPQSANIR